MEHHSNDLPWRSVAKTIHIETTVDGYLNEADFDEQLERYGQRLALVAITGASNVTGNLNPFHRLAEKAHAVGAQIVVDCAQLAPHRKIDMRPLDDLAHLDYVTLSAHKMYAPLGTGALIGRRDTFERGDPDMRGGGTVEIVTLGDVVWAEPPDRDEAGSPNTVGAIAMAAAIQQLETVGMDQVADHEAKLTAYALERLNSIPGLRIFGDDQSSRANKRLGVIPFHLEGISHFLVAAIVGHEFGIGVRSGCFCAHPYILHLLKISPEESKLVQERMMSGDRSDMPGLIRASFGLYNTIDEIEALAEALSKIAVNNYKGKYIQEIESGEFIPQGWTPKFENYFSV
jgi:selenocysteine lyase/cysteine desulfurase